MACYVTDQLDRRRVKARLDGHRLTFFRGDHRFEREIVINRLPATFMNVARCGADLRVLIGRGDPLSAGSPYGLVSHALRERFGIQGGVALEEQQAKLSA